jgi:hypothetical protein
MDEQGLSHHGNKDVELKPGATLYANSKSLPLKATPGETSPGERNSLCGLGEGLIELRHEPHFGMLEASLKGRRSSGTPQGSSNLRSRVRNDPRDEYHPLVLAGLEPNLGRPKTGMAQKPPSGYLWMSLVPALPIYPCSTQSAHQSKLMTSARCG